MNNYGFSLVGCIVSSGFEFKDFELFKREQLIVKYSNYESIITKLTVE